MPVHMPASVKDFVQLPPPDHRARLDLMPGSDVPVIRQPYQAGDPLPFWARGDKAVGQHHLYDLDLDPDEGENRVGEASEVEMIDLLRTALETVEAPHEQYQRLGIA